MIKILYTSIIITMMFSNISFANTDLDNNGYKNMINNYFGEMNLYIEDTKSGSLKDLFFCDIDNGYIKVERDNLEEIKNGFDELRNNIQNVKLKDSNTDTLHHELINQLDKVVNSANEGINNKNYVLGINGRINKIGSMLMKDDNIVNNIKDDLNDLNRILEKIDNL